MLTHPTLDQMQALGLSGMAAAYRQLAEQDNAADLSRENFQKYSEIKWPDAILNGKYGKVGISFLAEVCQYGDAGAQRAVRETLKKSGAAAGRALWYKLILEAEHWDLVHKYTIAETCGWRKETPNAVGAVGACR